MCIRDRRISAARGGRGAPSRADGPPRLDRQPGFLPGRKRGDSPSAAAPGRPGEVPDLRRPPTLPRRGVGGCPGGRLGVAAVYGLTHFHLQRVSSQYFGVRQKLSFSQPENFATTIQKLSFSPVY